VATSPGSALVRLLRDMPGLEREPPREQFAEQLSRLVNLPDSIKIAAALGGGGERNRDAAPAEASAARDELQRVRETLLGAVDRSFEPGSRASRIRLPHPGPPRWDEGPAACAPYLKFYMAHQAQFDATVQGLHLRIRTMAAGTCDALARLAALDLALADTLYPSARRFYAGVPALAGARFEELLQQSSAADEDEVGMQSRWERLLAAFSEELRSLLAAELEARLLPVLGLVEAIEEQTNTGTA
jgi:hypothetical protein